MSENPNQKTIESQDEPSEVEVFWAFVAYLFFFLPLLSKHRKSKFVWYHLKQAFVLFILSVVAYFLAGLTDWLFLRFLIFSSIFILWCFGAVNVLLGKKRALPVVGRLARILP